MMATTGLQDPAAHWMGMQARAVWAAIVALTFIGIATEVNAQAATPVNIPLEYWQCGQGDPSCTAGTQKLAINARRSCR
jgi:hypothetical protein